MQLVTRDGRVLSFYPDDVTVPDAAIADGAIVQAYAGAMDALGRVGAPPFGDDVPDTRAYAAPPVDLLAYAKQVRWRYETMGITVAGLRVATDDRSKTLLNGAVIEAQNDPDFTTPWAATDGTEHVLDAETVKALGKAVSAHVRKVFKAYSDVSKALAAGTMTTVAQIDAAFVAALT